MYHRSPRLTARLNWRTRKVMLPRMSPLLLIFLILSATASWFLLPMVARRMSEKRLAAACRRSRSIVLSIDDGPSSELSSRILETLERHDIRASLFFLGRNARANPSQASSFVDAGHEIGSHTFDHANGWKSSPFRWAKDFSRGQGEIHGILGYKPHLFRPPYGKLSLAGLVQAYVSRTRLCWWTLDTKDTMRRLPADEVLQRLEREGGGVVLMHDLDRHDGVEDELSHSDYVIDLIDKIASFSRERGYRIVTFADLELG